MPLPPCNVQLVSAGRVFEVLRWAEEWKQRADPSLVRHLVFGILEVAAPPYSPDFAGSMLRWDAQHGGTSGGAAWGQHGGSMHSMCACPPACSPLPAAPHALPSWVPLSRTG